jgi:preprotein translocase subunit SecG
MVCPNIAVGTTVNYLSIIAPLSLIGIVILHSQRAKIIGGVISKPSYKLRTAYALNGIYAIVVVVTAFVLFLFLLGPALIEGELAHCVSPLA